MSFWTRRRQYEANDRIALAAISALLAIAVPARAQDMGLPEPPPAASSAPAVEAPVNCTKGDFETVVDQSAATLRDLNLQNRPRFQEKLRALRDKNAWSEDQFLKEAVPYVKDDQIDSFDRKTNELLNRIASMGDEGSSSAKPDCALYVVLRGHMTQLVETQNAKWAYMFQKIEAALAQ